MYVKVGSFSALTRYLRVLTLFCNSNSSFNKSRLAHHSNSQNEYPALLPTSCT